MGFMGAEGRIREGGKLEHVPILTAHSLAPEVSNFTNLTTWGREVGEKLVNLDFGGAPMFQGAFFLEPMVTPSRAGSPALLTGRHDPATVEGSRQRLHDAPLLSSRVLRLFLMRTSRDA